MRKAGMMAVYRPLSGGTPEAIANASASGNATMPTTTPASRSRSSCSREIPSRMQTIDFGTNNQEIVQGPSSAASRHLLPAGGEKDLARVPLAPRQRGE